MIYITCRKFVVLEDSHPLHLMEHRVVRCINLITAVNITGADEG